MEGLLGMIKLYAAPQPPDGWMNCDGALLSQEDFPELYAMIGQRYGGDEGGNFALPDMGSPGMGQYVARVKPAADPNSKGMLSQITLYMGQDIPEGWIQCDGRMLKVAEYPILSKLMGNQNGGDGIETFGVPNAPVQNGIAYLLCVDGLDPREGESQDGGDDDDDY